MVSRIGRTTASKRLLKATNMPIGTPIPTAIITETTRTLIVSIAESQYPLKPMNRVAAAQNSPSHLPPSLNPNIAATATTTIQGSQRRNVSNPARPVSITSEIGLKNQARLSPNHSKEVSIGSWMGGSQLSGQFPKSVPTLLVASE